MIHQTIGHFQVLELLGKGGFGEVYRARDTLLDRIVALKVLHAEFAGDMDRCNQLREEARAASTLNHPHVCTIYELAEFSGGFYIAMELVNGRTLRQRIGEGLPTIHEAVRIGRQVAAALAEAHAHGVIHRDVTAANVMVTVSGEVKIVDFGLAKIVMAASIDKTSESTASQLGRPIGTLSYMPPEQLMGQRLTARSDLFSFGVVLYELTAGRLPFRGASLFEIADAILHDEPDTLILSNPDVPPALQTLITRMLSKDPHERPRSAQLVLLELNEISRRLRPAVEGVSNEGVPLPSQSKPVRPRSIVVLPFANIGADKEHDYFSDGLTEDLTDALANLEGLRVASRTSAFDPKLQNRDIREIASRLNVDTVLQGSVRRSGTRLRVSVQLINALDGYHIWSQRFDREMANVFEVQDEIARSIADKLRGTLVSSSPAPLIKRYTDNVDAYNLYLKGRYYWNRRHEGGIQKALTYFNQALQQSPGYALAESGVADCFSVLAFYNYLAPRDGFGKAEAAAMKALAIDEELAEAHTSLGLVRTFFDWDFEGGERQFLRSIQLNPRYGTAHFWYGLHEIAVGRSASAIASLKRACEAEPLSVNFNGAVAVLSYYARQYDEAIDAAQKTLELEPLFGPAHAFLGWTYAQTENYEGALAEWQQAVTLLGGMPAAFASLAQIHALAGQRTEAVKILRELDELRPHRYVSSYHVAGAHVALQQYEEAVAWLERAREERSNWLTFIRVDPIMDPVRADPRIRSIEASVFDGSAKLTHPTIPFDRGGDSVRR